MSKFRRLLSLVGEGVEGSGCRGTGLANCKAHVNVDQQSPPAVPKLKILRVFCFLCGPLCFMFFCVSALSVLLVRDESSASTKRNQRMHKRAAAFPPKQSNTFLSNQDSRKNIEIGTEKQNIRH